jgi:hypothetical protein
MEKYLTERRKSDCSENAKKCEINIETSYILQNCKIANNLKYLYVKHLCLDKFIELGGSTIDRTGLNYLIAYIDVAGILVLLITIYIIIFDMRKVKKIYKSRNKIINQFTVHINDLSWNFMEFDVKMNKLALHLDKIIELGIQEEELKSNKEVGNIEINEQNKQLNKVNDIELLNINEKQKDSFIYEINYPYIGDKKLNHILEKDKLIKDYKEKKLLLDELIEKNDPKDELKITKKKEKLEKNRIKIENIIKLLEDNEQVKDLIINDVFITFTHPIYNKYLVKTYSKTKCTRCCYIFCCKFKKIKHLYFENNWINMEKNPDNPSDIKWENMLLTKTKKFFSKSISILLAFFLILIGFMFVVLGKYYQEKLNKEFNIQIDCKFVQIDKIDEIIKEYNSEIPARNKFQVFCFCENIVNKNGFTTAYDYKFPETNVLPCQNYVNSFLAYNSLNYLIIFMIPIINSVITASLTLLTSLEKNNKLTQDNSSNMIKIFLGQFFNTGLLLLIVNARINVIKDWSNDFPIFTGLYSDFSPAWFLNIGCTIFFTMIISIFTIHLGPIIGALIQFIFRCFDSGNQIGVGSKKNVKSVFMDLYMGPQFQIDAKYAQVIILVFYLFRYYVYFTLVCYIPPECQDYIYLFS